jgi:hypothetical protein
VPARPTRLDEITEKLHGSAVVGIVSPRCCFKTSRRSKTCTAAAVVMLTMSYLDGHTEIYLLCRRDLKTVLEHNPDAFVRETQQSMFVLNNQ